jgi:uncharacterized protein YndB with AHSA1/START domain
MGQTTQNSRLIKAPAEKIYQAFTNAKALEAWQTPGDMIGKVHSFDLRKGGGYKMSLFYPETEKEMRGKTSENEDRFTAEFIELTPPYKIVEAIKFDTADPNFSGEMIMEVTLEPASNGTKVTFLFRNLPTGIRPEDNESGTLSSLQKLAEYVE